MNLKERTQDSPRKDSSDHLVYPIETAWSRNETNRFVHQGPCIRAATQRILISWAFPKDRNNVPIRRTTWTVIPTLWKLGYDLCLDEPKEWVDQYRQGVKFQS
jgi:hypothetical protein